MQQWRRLLTATFDVLLVRRKSLEAFRLASEAHSSDNAALFNYHEDHWIFQTDAYSERALKMLKLSCRTLPLTKPAKTLERETVDEVHTFQQLFRERIRNPLAHGGGDGVLALDPYWDAVVAAKDLLDIELVMATIAAGPAVPAPRRAWRLDQYALNWRALDQRCEHAASVVLSSCG
jgi:hypothetical protein